MRRLLALAAAATVAADVVQVAVLCNYIEARIADRQDCDAIIAAVDAINDKEDGVLDGLLPDTILNLTLAFEGCGDSHPDTGLGDDAFVPSPTEARRDGTAPARDLGGRAGGV